jgi:hypothetical protein
VTTSFDYDQQLNTLDITDPLGRSVESYELDLLDRPVKVTNVESQEMSIVYGVVKNHQGEIKVRSGVGKGTTFSIQIPLAPSINAHGS